MAYTQVSLPAPAANGSGAAVDVSTFGATKTVTVSAGGNDVHQPSVLIEVSNQSSPTKWAPLVYFQPDGEETVTVACRWMRATVVNFVGGDAPTVEVGGDDAGAEFATLVAPSGDGDGAGVDTSSLGPFKTVHVAGPFRGVVNIEISQDGGASYSQALSFPSGEAGIQSATFQADFMRVSRDGVPTIDPGTPIVNVGGATDAGSGGGGSTVTVFRYTADGTEGDTFTVNLPAARASNLYNVQVTYGGPNNLKVVSALVATFTQTQFDVSLSAAAEDGDIFMFAVQDLPLLLESGG